MNPDTSAPPSRPAWIEVDLSRLRANYRCIEVARDSKVGFIAVIKDDAYGHGAAAVAREAVKAGARWLALATIEEAQLLRRAGINAPILMLGQRHPDEIEECVRLRLSCAVADETTAALVNAESARQGAITGLHLKVDTGMNRYGVRWNQAADLVPRLLHLPHVRLEGVFSHFAMSDELDKTYARLQLARFRHALEQIESTGWNGGVRHFCNSGGFLDLPEAHFDLVRIGLLPLGVYPSQVCRRLPDIEPVMTVKTRLAFIRELEAGDCVGYGMRYTATDRRRIAVLPVGYGDGFPRVRNQGDVLVRGKRAPLIGGVAMDAITIDITHIPEAQLWDEAVLMGRQGTEQISVHDVAKLKGSVSYDVLTSWRERLPRVYLGAVSQGECP